MEMITIWDTAVAGISGLGVWFCGGGWGDLAWGCGFVVGGVGGYEESTALNRLNNDRVIFEVRSPIG